VRQRSARKDPVGYPDWSLHMRPFWYDRNPKSKDYDYSGVGVDPHPATTHVTYTVPTGRKFFLENALAIIIRTEAATVSGSVRARVIARGRRIVTARMQKNAVGDSAQMNVGRSVILREGESIKLETADYSTGGKIDYLLAFHGIEFDA